MAVHTLEESLLGFVDALRAAGVAAGPDRCLTFLAAVAAVRIDDRQATFWAGQATLCAGPDDLPVYDRVFAAWFLHHPVPPAAPGRYPGARRQASLDDTAERGDGDEVDYPTASELEVLRHRDVATLSPQEQARLRDLFEVLRPTLPARPARRRRAFRRGQVDPYRTLRRSLARLGEPAEIAWRRRSTRPRRVALLVDVSGSMKAYADALLRLAHRFAVGGGVEVFTMGTRLTRITRAMRIRDVQDALTAAGRTVPDWSGGTRLGETLKAFLDRWGQREVARGAVVVIFSDGWERGDTAVLGEQMRRLRRLAHRIVWVNPHQAGADYQPVQRGMLAAAPHVHHLVPGHSIAAFADLVDLVGGARRPGKVEREVGRP